MPFLPFLLLNDARRDPVSTRPPILADVTHAKRAGRSPHRPVGIARWSVRLRPRAPGGARTGRTLAPVLTRSRSPRQTALSGKDDAGPPV